MRAAIASLFAAATFFGTGAPAFADLPPLIPREVLFGNPEKTGPQISPDGKYIAYLRPDDKNVLQVWVYPTDKKADDAVAVTQDPKRGIRQFFWAHDGKHLLYMQDKGGDENFHLFAVDVKAKTTRELTPFDGVRVQGVDLDKHHPNEVLVGMNKRDKAAFDMHRIKLDSGEEKLDTQNPGGAVGFDSDAKFQVRGCTIAKPDGGYEVKVKGDDGKWKTVKSVGADDQAQLAGFGTDPNTVWLIHSGDANALRLVKLDVASGKETVIAEDKQYDVGGAMIDDDKRIPLAVSFTKARTEWTVLDDSVKDDFAALAKVARGDFSVGSQTAEKAKWVVSYVTDDGPAAFYLYDRATKKADLLFTTNRKLEGVKLAQMQPFEFKAKDGLTVHGYATLPVGVEHKNLPAVLLVHGGPWARDTWGYSGMVQWLANRGYAVIQVNFRGSTGYGKGFLNAANKEWSGKMHQDLIDAVDHFAKAGTVDAKKTAIMGGSYGGYATLVGLTFTPEQFACGVDIVGPSNLNTLLGTIPPYWAPMKAMFAKRVGDDKDFLEKCSPIYRADQITKPLLIGQGANDPRVKQAESDQIVEAMRKNKKEVQYVLYPDEGHGFARPENRLHFFAVSEQFLAKHLGGRAEPVGEIKGHSGQMK
jgi:dipeptidyl aminopeptidase/acylaminoacyl peptidase